MVIPMSTMRMILRSRQLVRIGALFQAGGLCRHIRMMMGVTMIMMVMRLVRIGGLRSIRGLLIGSGSAFRRAGLRALVVRTMRLRSIVCLRSGCGRRLLRLSFQMAEQTSCRVDAVGDVVCGAGGLCSHLLVLSLVAGSLGLLV